MKQSGYEIAIIGMAGRFPGAGSVDELWRVAVDGTVTLSRFTDEQMLADGVPDELRNHPDYVGVGGVLDDIEGFDHRFFRYSAREAATMDPQQRLFLETSWAALESAGYGGSRGGGHVGVYAAAGFTAYLTRYVTSQVGTPSGPTMHEMVLGNDKDMLATRVSYHLGLRGPAITVQTACSSSLVAVHLASQALLAGDCDLALAGGVSVRVPQHEGFPFEPGSVLSPDGSCLAFDSRAQGTVFGNGVGVVVLKPLDDAQREGDTVVAVIRGTAINNDGAGRAGYTAPSVAGQAAVIRAAQRVAGTPARTISYVESHGTGTQLGDPIEFQALTEAFRETTDERGFCVLGAVKPLIGHLDAAAGIAGLIKTALALRHRTLPATPYLAEPNPAIDVAPSPFRMITQARPWEASAEHPRRAAVSSFGIGGTNAHVILEEAPPERPIDPSPASTSQLLVVSARTPQALRVAGERLGKHLANHPELDLADVAHTLRVGRAAMPVRLAVVCDNRADAVPQLIDASTLGTEAAVGPVVFLFPGQGSQHPGMATEIYATEPEFRTWFDRCARHLEPMLGWDLMTILSGDVERLRDTRFTQPVLFAVEYALARLWMSWGVQPDALVGYSLGEYVAACLAGTFTLEDALRLVATRARLCGARPRGAMLAVHAAPDEIVDLLNTDVDITALNAARLCVIGGSPAAVAAVAKQLAARNVETAPVHTSHAFHSSTMDPAVPPMADAVAMVSTSAPRIPFVSTVTGSWITDERATDPGYWAGQLRAPVRFHEALTTLLAAEPTTLLEVGPGTTLATLARQHEGVARHTVISSLPHPRQGGSATRRLQAALGRVWQAGAEVDWAAYGRSERRRRVPLPTYPFEHVRAWIGEPATLSTRHTAAGPASRPGRPVGSTADGIAAIWAELLGQDRVHPGQDFFELGGHSLLASRILSRVRSRFGVSLPVATMFDAPTVRQLAGEVDRAMRLNGDAPTKPADPGGAVSRHARLSAAQERLWFLDRLDPGDPAYNVVFALRLHGPVRVDDLSNALVTVIERHPALRTVFRDVDGVPYQLVDAGPKPALEVLDLRAQPAEADRERARLAANRFTLDSGPLLLARLLRLGEVDWHLLIAVHHIVFDGWSTGVLVGELLTAYGGGGLPPARPDVLDHLISDATTDGELAYWRERLAGAPALSTVPTDRRRPETPTHRGAHRPFALPDATAAALIRFARDTGASLNAVVLAGFAALLHRASGQTDVLLGVPVAMRDDESLQGVIGCLANTVIVRVDLSRDPTGRELVTRVHRSLGAAVRHAAAPLSTVVRAVAPNRDPSYNPLFQCLVSLNEVDEQSRTERGVTATLEDVETGTTDFDLFLTMRRCGTAIDGVLGYNTDLYLDETAGDLIAELAGIFDELTERPDSRLSHRVAPQRTARIIGTVTTQPIADTLDFWSGFLRLGLRPRFAPFGQVIQELLAADEDGPVVAIVRADDRSALDGLRPAVLARRARTSAPLLLVVGPSCSAGAMAWEEELAGLAIDVPEVRLIWTQSWLSRAAVSEVFDARSEQLAQIPYTPEVYAVMGTLVAHALGDRLGPERERHVDAQVGTAAAIFARARPVAAAGTTARPAGVAPRTPTEHRLLPLWTELLGVAEVGVTDDFFELGGHSLLATRLLARVHRELGADVSLYELFIRPTVADLARLIDGARPGDTAPRLVPVPRDGRLAPSAAQHRMWSVNQIRDAGHHTALILELDGDVDGAALHRAVDRIVARHEALRTTFAPVAGRPWLVIGERAECWLPHLDLCGMAADQRRRALATCAAEIAETPYDLAAGPLLRVRLVTTGEHRHELYLGMHHLVCDAQSWQVFLSELGVLYDAFHAGLPDPLPALGIQYADYAAWRRRTLAGPALTTGQDWWRDRMSGVTPTLDLAGVEVGQAKASQVEITVPADVMAAARECAKRERVTLFTLLASAWAAVLHRNSGTDDVVLGVPTSGRPQPELAHLIGYFADLVPLRLTVSGPVTWRGLLRRTHESAAVTLAHQHVPLAQIVEATRVPRDPDRHPLFQWVLNYAEEPVSPPRLTGLVTRRREVPMTTSEFDAFIDVSWRAGDLVVAAAHRMDASVMRDLLAEFRDTLRAAVEDPGGLAVGEPAAEPTVLLAGPEATRLASRLPAGVAVSTMNVGPLRALTDPAGPLATPAARARVLLVPFTGRHRSLEAGVQALESQAGMLVRAVRRHREWSAAPLTVTLLPDAGNGWAGVCARLADGIRRQLAALPDVDVVVGEEPVLERVRSAMDVEPPTTPGLVGPRTKRERLLADIWADLLHLDTVGVHDDFFELGGDSMLAVQAAYRAGEVGIELTPGQFVDAPTIAELLATSRAGTAPSVTAGAGTGPAPITGAQQWFLDVVAPGFRNPAHFNHPYYFELLRPVPVDRLHGAVRALVARHDALRLRLEHEDRVGWRQWFAEPDELAVPLERHDLAAVPEAEREAMMATIAAAAQSSLDLTSGPLCRVLHFDLGATGRLLLVNHHLVTDGASRGLIMADLAVLCDQPARLLPAVTTSYQDWAWRLDAYARSDELLAELPYWLTRTENSDVGDVPADDPTAENRFAQRIATSSLLSEDETSALWQHARRLCVGISTMVVWSAAGMLADWTGRDEWVLDLASHGRERVVRGADPARTVGWFQVYYPLPVRVVAGDEDPAGVLAVAESLRSVPHGGIGYGLLRGNRRRDAASERLAALPMPAVSVNYMGHFRADSAEEASDLLAVCQAPYGVEQDEHGVCPYSLDLVASMVNRRLRLEVVHSSVRHRRDTIGAVLDRWRRRLASVTGWAGG